MCFGFERDRETRVDRNRGRGRARQNVCVFFSPFVLEVYAAKQALERPVCLFCTSCLRFTQSAHTKMLIHTFSLVLHPHLMNNILLARDLSTAGSADAELFYMNSRSCVSMFVHYMNVVCEAARCIDNSSRERRSEERRRCCGPPARCAF